MTGYTIQPIGVIRSELDSLEGAPLQGYEGAPEVWLEVTAQVEQGLAGITAGDELFILTWLHRARRAQGASTREARGTVDGRVRDEVAGSSQPRGTSSSFGPGGRRAEVEGRAN